METLKDVLVGAFGLLLVFLAGGVVLLMLLAQVGLVFYFISAIPSLF